MAVLAIALGVALGYAVQLINHSALGEFAQALQTLSGDADLTVRGPRAGFDESLYPQIARLPEVAVASPMVEVEANVQGREQPLRIVGIDVFRAGQIQPALLAEAGDLEDALRADAIFLSPAASQWLGVGVGDTVLVQVGLRDVALRVAGALRADGTGQRLAVMDIAAAQWLLDRLGRLTRIDVKLRPGADPAAAQARIQALLPAGLHTERPDASVRSTARLTRAYRVNLNVLALVALFTGGLLVFSTQALAVVRRRAQLALLRVLGVTRARCVALLLAEGALLGVIGRRCRRRCSDTCWPMRACAFVGAGSGRRLLSRHHRDAEAGAGGARRVLHARRGGRHARQPDARAGGGSHCNRRARSRRATKRTRSSASARRGRAAC